RPSPLGCARWLNTPERRRMHSRLTPALTYAPFQAGEFRWSMGLAPLDLDDWIEIDDLAAAELGEKERLLGERHGEVFAALPEARAGSEEVLALLTEHLPSRFPGVYRRNRAEFTHVAAGRCWPLDDATLHPLDLAGRMVQEDLCLMREDPGSGEYRLVGASLCFPTGWTLADKMGGSVSAIHAPIPNYGTQLESTMDRFFNRIKVERPVWRLNWNLMSHPALFQPRGHIRGETLGEVTAANAGDRLWLRVERQTLRRLPRSGDVLFTIRIYVRPLRDLCDHPEEAVRLAATLAALPDDVRRYKGLPSVLDGALGWLNRILPSGGTDDTT
ncbi:MAG TPA: DUF3445 domain-containing protein, partial [Dehalococcoidia bacterium]|nr:DUF3445 domain-containing protein [Dehalococcoidia bacterium]